MTDIQPEPVTLARAWIAGDAAAGNALRDWLMERHPEVGDLRDWVGFTLSGQNGFVGKKLLVMSPPSGVVGLSLLKDGKVETMDERKWLTGSSFSLLDACFDCVRGSDWVVLP